MYCLKCKRVTNTLNEQRIISKNGRPMKRGICAVCGKVKMQFIKKKLTIDGRGVKWSDQLAEELHKPTTR